MTRLDSAPEVIELARDLGVTCAAPVEGILEYCRRRIDGWVTESGCVSDIVSLESLITQRLQMVFEEIRSNDDFNRLTETYAKVKKDPVFAAMRQKFDDDLANPTYGALIQRRNVGPDAHDRFVAIIDCRGNKLARRFFTRWHEIAHRLTTLADLLEPVYRSEHDPIEKMMDEIAGHIGFYEPFFGPAFQQAHGIKTILKFDTVESIISSRFPTASFQSTLIACIRRMPTPVVYLEAALAHKKNVKREIEDDSPRLFAAPPPPPGELRAVKVHPNKAAQQQRFSIPENMRVPASSLITRLFAAEPITDGASSEDLSHWESRGKSLEGRALAVEARKVPDRVIAIVQPLEPMPKINLQNRSVLFSK